MTIIIAKDHSYEDDHQHSQEKYDAILSSNVVIIFQLGPCPSCSPSNSPRLGSSPNSTTAIYNVVHADMLREPSTLLTMHIDDHNRMYIGRDPGMFHVIAEYLRTGELPSIKDLDRTELKQLKEDVKFFRLRKLKKMLSDEKLIKWTADEDKELPEPSPVCSRRLGGF